MQSLCVFGGFAVPAGVSAWVSQNEDDPWFLAHLGRCGDADRRASPPVGSETQSLSLVGRRAGAPFLPGRVRGVEAGLHAGGLPPRFRTPQRLADGPLRG